MDGVLVIDKPSGRTSHDIVDIIRKATGMKKVGHTGTLDPMATGVLVLLLGRATRIGRFLELEPKEYIAGAVFGIVTDTQDITGTVLQESNTPVTIDALRAVMPDFTGTISQVPPMVSAIKIGGKTLYKLARQGKEIERPERNITIFELELLDFSIRDGRAHAVFRVLCSGGTYVRTLVHDIGTRLGAGATLENLRRTRVGVYTLSQAVTVDEANRETIETRLISMDSALAHLPQVIVQNSVIGLLLNGQKIDAQGMNVHPESVVEGEFVRIKSENGVLLALGKVTDEIKFEVKPEIVVGSGD
ncbi:MAG: tRNA pseudouridine(55) synthase TruB [Candidatus Aquicultor sp.]